jgi:hypothetical protein
MVSNGTWVLIECWVALRKAAKLNQCGSRVIGRQAKAALASDHKECATNVGDKIEGFMAAGELKEAWCCLKEWYNMVEDCAPKASHDTLVCQTKERIALYASVPPPGRCSPSMCNLLTSLTMFPAIWRLGRW